jgi:hypothetical protein
METFSVHNSMYTISTYQLEFFAGRLKKKWQARTNEKKYLVPGCSTAWAKT